MGTAYIRQPYNDNLYNNPPFLTNLTKATCINMCAMLPFSKNFEKIIRGLNSHTIFNCYAKVLAKVDRKRSINDWRS